MSQTIALAMIVKGTKDEARLLNKCLSNINRYVDAIYLNINHLPGGKVDKEVLKIAEKYKATYFTTEWTGNFVTARNFIFGKVPKKYDWIMWLDSDDTVDNPQEIKKIINVASKNQHGIYVNYNYAYDEFGNVTVKHYVARLVRNNGTYRWKSSIDDEGVSVHETLNEVTPRPKAMCNDFNVCHHAELERQRNSLRRNIDMLELMYDKQTANGKLDPRTLFYLATHYYDVGNYYRTKELLQTYMQLSGWAEERCEALVYLGKIYDYEGKTDQAHHAFLLAIGEYQNSPRPYIELSKTDYKMKRYQDSADWIEKALQLPKPSTTMVLRPMESTFEAYMLAAQAYVNIGGDKLDAAKKYITKALKLRPLDTGAQASRDLIDSLINQRENIRAAIRICNAFGDKSQIVPFLDKLPYDVQDNPLILNTRFANTEPKVWGDKTIAIYVGQGPLGIWGPWSLKDGIGGSEEAVIKLSDELSKLGWSVTVFATPGDKSGEYGKSVRLVEENVDTPSERHYYTDNAVAWKQYYEFNPKDEYNILISWRNPNFFDYDIKAKKKYLWLHDVMPKEDFLEDRLKNIDKVIFVGKYHAELYRGVIPEEKWFISGNGIDPSDFHLADGEYERKPKRLIYMSSYNRGLQILLEGWDKIKKAVPDVTLDVYYGWQSFDALNATNPERMAWRNKMDKMMKSLDGVTEHGRIGHDKIIEEINKADIFAYPCIFPEVYCISYVKAMAGGAIPVTSDYAEIKYYDGIHVHFEEGKIDEFEAAYIDKLIDVLKNGTDLDRKVLSSDARSKYSWAQTAKQWDEEFNGRHSSDIPRTN